MSAWEWKRSVKQHQNCFRKIALHILQCGRWLRRAGTPWWGISDYAYDPFGQVDSRHPTHNTFVHVCILWHSSKKWSFIELENIQYVYLRPGLALSSQTVLSVKIVPHWTMFRSPITLRIPSHCESVFVNVYVYVSFENLSATHDDWL